MIFKCKPEHYVKCIFVVTLVMVRLVEASSKWSIFRCERTQVIYYSEQHNNWKNFLPLGQKPATWSFFLYFSKTLTTPHLLRAQKISPGKFCFQESDEKFLEARMRAVLHTSFLLIALWCSKFHNCYFQSCFCCGFVMCP